MLLAQETAAVKEEGELQAMLFTMLQEQHKKRTAQHDKDDPPPGLGIDQTKQPQKQKALCPHCKKFVFLKPDNCTKLEANKDKRWLGWKSVHAIA